MANFRVFTAVLDTGMARYVPGVSVGGSGSVKVGAEGRGRFFREMGSKAEQQDVGDGGRNVSLANSLTLVSGWLYYFSQTR